MKHHIIPLCVLALAGCSTSSQSVEEDALGSSQENAPVYLDLRDRSSETEIEPGEWDVVGGSRICRGYLTHVESVEFCAKSVPRDWTSFTHDGQTYYVQPLSGS